MQLSNNLQSSSLHLYELDLLRFLAAIAVVFFHYTFLNSINSELTPTYPSLEGIFKYGYLGVELFFMISGFVILLTAMKKTAFQFTISRIKRLYPAFWVALIITTLAILFFSIDQKTTVGLKEFLFNFTMVPEYLGSVNIDPVYWTLQVEIKFYFWIGVILFLRKIEHIELFIMIWLCFSVLEMFHFAHHITHFILIPEWAPYFCAGALLFRIRAHGLTRQRTLMLLIAYVLSIYFAIQGAEERTILYKTYFSPVVTTFIISFFYLLFILVISKSIKQINSPTFAIIGALTYPLYLIHNVLGEIVFSNFSGIMNKYLLLAIVIALMLLISTIISRYFEPAISKFTRL